MTVVFLATVLTCATNWSVFFVNPSCNFVSSFCNSGDTDAVIPVTSTRYSIDALKLPTVQPWRAWYDEGQVNHLMELHSTFVLVSG